MLNRDELSQKELDDIFYGKRPAVSVKFFDAEVLDPSASRAAGKRVMCTRTHVDLSCPAEKAACRRPATEEDQQMWPEQWAEYERSKRDVGSGSLQNVQPSGEEPRAIHPFAVAG
jgi:hypothetical protein